jgi:hypothetical protein
MGDGLPMVTWLAYRDIRQDTTEESKANKLLGLSFVILLVVLTVIVVLLVITGRIRTLTHAQLEETIW